MIGNGFQALLSGGNLCYLLSLQHLAPKEKRMESQLTHVPKPTDPTEGTRPWDCLGRVVWGCTGQYWDKREELCRTTAHTNPLLITTELPIKP